MRSTRILVLFAAALLAQSVLAHGSPHGPKGPIGKLRTQVDALAERIQALEDSAPVSSVEGRTYCFVLNLLIMRGVSVNSTEQLASAVIRRRATFLSGSFSAVLLSHVRNNQLDDGTVTLTLEPSPDPLLAAYTQTGNKIDIVFPDGSSANWYVSKDGSVIHGATNTSAGPFGPVTVGITRNWTLVENDTCDMEGQ